MKMQYIFVVLLAVLAQSMAGVPVKLKQNNLPFVGSYKVNRYEFGNGLRLIVMEDKSSPTFAYQTWFNVGSRDEVPGKTGLAHLFEHMMFKQTKNLGPGEFDKTLEQAGVEGLNAFTSWDYTAYIQELPKEKLELIVKLEAERMHNLIVDDKAFKTETEVVQNERRFRKENNPEGLMYQELLELSFKKHSYRWPVIGYQEDLEAMVGKDGLDFYRKYYSPNNATIVVVGDVKSNALAKMVHKYYGHISSREIVRPEIIAEPPQDKIRRKRIALNIKVEKLLLGYQVPEIQHADAPVFEVIQGLLSDGKSGRLRRRLVETGLSTDISSGSFQNKDPSLFIFEADMQKGKRAVVAANSIREELEILKKSPPSEAEVKRAKNLILFDFYNRLSENSHKARYLGRFETMTGDYRNGLMFYDKVSKVTAEDIQRVSQKYFVMNQSTEILGVPKSI